MNVEEIKRLYSKKDKMHNFSHIFRIRKNANKLSKGLKIDKKLLNFLILFHGLKNYAKENKKDFDKKYVKSLLRYKNPKEIEEKIIIDANTLDNIGKQGIKKALFVGRKIGRSDKKTFDYIKKNLKNLKFYTKMGKNSGKKQIKIMRKMLK